MKRRSIISLLAALIISCNPILPLNHQNTVSAAADSHWLNYKFDSFSSDTLNQDFTASGAAEVPAGSNFIRLTPATPLQSGAVFNKNALCDKNNYSFSTAFSFKMSNTSPQGPSDGLTFTLQTGTSSQLANGGGLGYYGIQPSFAIKYDTFLNTVYNDPSANYIGIAENGTVTNQDGWFTELNQYNTDNGTNYVLSNGTQYYTWIDYDGVNKNVQVRLGTTPDRASSKQVLDVNGIDLDAIFDGKPFYAGFTASTGSPNYENHDIYNWYFVNEYAPIETLNPQNDYKLNEAPSLPNDTKTTGVNTPVSGQAVGTDPDGDTLTYSQGKDPGHGTVTVNPDGSWTYTPEVDFVGVDSFTVRVDDGKCAEAEATVTVNVSSNNPPTAPEDKVTTDKDTPVSGTVKGTDPDGGTLTYSKGKDPEHGNVTVNEDGTWTYTPNPDFVGEDSFTIIVEDGQGGKTEVPVTVNVTEQNTPPTPPPLCGDRVVLINGSFEEPEYDPQNPDLVAGPGYFAVYDPNVPGWRTTASSKRYDIFNQELMDKIQPGSINDQQGLKNTVPHGQQMAELNSTEASQLYQDIATVPGQTIYWRLAHKGRYGVDTMAVKIGSSNTSPKSLPTIRTISTGKDEWKYYTGTYVVPAGQTFTRFGFEAISSANGDLTGGNFLDDIFLGTSPCGVVTKSVSPVDDVQEGDTLTYSVNFKNNGGDETGNTVFTDNIPDGTEYVPGSLEIVSGPNSGTLTDAKGDDQGEFLVSENRVVVRLGTGADGSQSGRIPNADVLPDGTTVQFKVKVLPKYKTSAVANQATVEYDNLLNGDHETRSSNGVTVDVNRPPITPDFEETTWKNTTVTGSLYGVDANGDSLTFDKGSDPQNGTVVVNPDGTWTYTPDPDFVGEDSFTVIVDDGKGGTSTSTVTVHVEDPPNQAPVTKNDNVTTQQDTSVTGSVYGTDPDGDQLTFNIETNPKHGTVIVNSDGTWKYEPDPGYSGPDIFTVTVDDGKGGVTTSTITVNVTEKPNQPPVTRDDTVTTPNNTKVTGRVYGSDPDGDPLTFTKGSDPQHGKVTVNQDGTWTYVPEPGYVGEDSFTVIVDDGRGGKIESKITVDVTESTPPTNHPPTASNKTVTTDKGTSVTGSVYGTDPDGDPLTYSKGKDPEHGNVTVNPDGTWSYTPDPGFVGEDSFTVIVDDGKGGTKEVTITVGVTEPSTPSTPSTPGTPNTPSPSNRPPAAPSDKVTTDKGSPVTGTVKGTDPDNDSLTYSKGKDPEHGKVTVNPDGTWSYTPDPGFVGEDSFTVIVDDGKGGKTEVPVTVDVKETNTPPVISDSGNGTTPSNPGNGTTPAEPGNGTDPMETGGDQTSPAVPDGESSPEEPVNQDLPPASVEVAAAGSEQTGVQFGSKLPNTATNLYNLGFLGIILLVAGLIVRRKNKA